MWVEPVPLPAAGFSFLPPPGYSGDLEPMAATLFNVQGTVILSLSAGEIEEGVTLDETLALFLDNMRADVPDLAVSPTTEEQVGGQPAVAAGISGTLFEEVFTGRVTVVYPDTGMGLSVLGLAVNPPAGKGWEKEGADDYAALLGSIAFFEPDPEAAACTVSTDPTYAYEEQNPVRVGGGAFGGPSRERAYLDTLLGPEGQPIEYERTGSTDGVDTILDIYVLTYDGAGSPVTIYLDEYSFEPLQAPMGLTCSGRFPVAPP